VAHLRSFLTFCSSRGLTRTRLDLIDTPRAYRGELPPRALPWNLVRKLLGSIDCSNIENCRDHAILHLMAYYGLRPSEASGLTVDSINSDSRTHHDHALRTSRYRHEASGASPSLSRCSRNGVWRSQNLRSRARHGMDEAALIKVMWSSRCGLRVLRRLIGANST
jgi:site-specific recombinase XerC